MVSISINITNLKKRSKKLKMIDLYNFLSPHLWSYLKSLTPNFYGISVITPRS